MVDAERRRHADRHHGNRETNTEAEHQGRAERELFKLEADEQDSNGSWAWDEPASEPKHHDLACGDVPIDKAPRRMSSA